MIADEELDSGVSAWLLLMDALPPRPPPPELRSRLLERVDGSARYLPFTATFGRLFDLDRDRSRALLMCAADRDRWKPAQAPVSAHFDFTGGPACTDLRAGFVALEGGTSIPRHRHTDREVTLVLEGSIQSDGRIYRPGMTLDMPAGSAHDFFVDPSGAILAVLHRRIEFLG